jgi:hypothetical protein
MTISTNRPTRRPLSALMPVMGSMLAFAAMLCVGCAIVGTTMMVMM